MKCYAYACVRTETSCCPITQPISSRLCAASLGNNHKIKEKTSRNVPGNREWSRFHDCHILCANSSRLCHCYGNKWTGNTLITHTQWILNISPSLSLVMYACDMCVSQLIRSNTLWNCSAKRTVLNWCRYPMRVFNCPKAAENGSQSVEEPTNDLNFNGFVCEERKRARARAGHLNYDSRRSKASCRKLRVHWTLFDETEPNNNM